MASPFSHTMFTLQSKTQSGFSLIEVLIVILIGMIIVAIAVPSILSSRRAANEGSSISTLRTLHGAQSTYLASVGAGNYAGTPATNGDTVGLVALRDSNLIDPVIANGAKSGYHFIGAISVAGPTTPATFFFSANPAVSSGIAKSGTRRFCVTEVGILGADYSNIAVAFDATTAETAPPLGD